MNIQSNPYTWMCVISVAYAAWFVGEVVVAVWQEVKRRKSADLTDSAKTREAQNVRQTRRSENQSV